MEASLVFGTLQRLFFGIGGLFGRRAPARPVRDIPSERPSSEAGPRSVIAAFEQGHARNQASQPALLKLAVARPTAPVAAPAAPVTPFERPTRVAAKIPATPVASVAVTPPPALAIPMPAEAGEAPARKMRSLEEVRADLARLRANAKERHAQLKAQAEAEAQARRDIGFAPTDFLDFAPAKTEAAPKNGSEHVASSFAPTGFFDLPSLKPEPARGAATESSYAPTAFFDLVNLKAQPAHTDCTESSFEKTAFCEPAHLKLVH